MSSASDQTDKVQDQTEALGLYLEALFTAPSVMKELLSDEVVDVSEHVENHLQQDGRPKWAYQAFQTLFIEIDEMDIAIPMGVMSGIRKYPQELEQSSDCAPWVDGIFQLQGSSIQIVNTRRLFLLSNDRQIETEKTFKKPEFIVQIGDGRWGLACHRADRVNMLEPEQVHWSRLDRKRSWLLGMIKEYRCPLLDGDEFISYLDSGAK